MIMVLATLLLFTIPVGMFANKLCLCMEPERPMGSRLWRSYLPLYNVLFMRKVAYGQHLIFSIYLGVIIALAAFRVLAVSLVTVAPVLTIFSAFGMAACLLLCFIYYAVNALDFCRMCDAGFLTTIVSLVCPPIGYYVLSVKIIPYFMSNREEVTNVFGTDNEA